MDTTTIYAFAALLIVLAAGMVYALLGKNDSLLPSGGVQWAGVVLGGAVILAGLWLVALAWNADQTISPDGARGRTATEIEEMDLSEPAEDFEFREVASQSVRSLSEYHGDVIVLNLWATWCAPCLQEIPELNRLQREYADRGVTVISVSDEAVADLAAFQNDLPLQTLSAFVDGTARLPGIVQAGFEIRPTTYIIDREGTVRKYILGARSFRYFERLVQPYL